VHIPFCFSAPLALISLQFTVLLSGGNAEEAFKLGKVLRIFINDVDLPIANHSFLGLQTEFSLSIGSHQILVGVHAVHGDVLIDDCPRAIYQASLLLAPCSMPQWFAFIRPQLSIALRSHFACRISPH